MSVVIKVENLSKQYRLGQVGTGSLGHDLNRWWHTARGKEDPYLKIGEANDRAVKGSSEYVWALQDINFEVKQGEVLGIIGRNGAGKSTLLKILSRTTSPTTGSVKIKGRVASLLEVGTGFHPELSGRENIFLNGAILGMTKQEIKNRFDKIVDFAGVERYIDTPVKRYSSGMYVRLAFGVAAHLEPEILIVDEVLAVGDTEFQKKCIGKMDEVSKQGRTVLFVSHQLGTIAQLCKSVILMNQGTILKKGKTDDIIDAYLKLQINQNAFYTVNINEAASKQAFFVSQKMIDTAGNSITEITNNDPIILEIKIGVQKWHEGLELALSLQHRIKGRVFTIHTNLKKLMAAGETEKTIRFTVPPNTITPNHYSWITAIHIPGLKPFDVLEDECSFLITDAGTDFARYEGVDYGVFNLEKYEIISQ